LQQCCASQQPLFHFFQTAGMAEADDVKPHPVAVAQIKSMTSQLKAHGDLDVRLRWPDELKRFPHGGLPPSSARVMQLLLRLQAAARKWIYDSQTATEGEKIVTTTHVHLEGFPSAMLMVMAEAALSAREIQQKVAGGSQYHPPQVVVKDWPDDWQEPEACFSLLRAMERGAIEGDIELCSGPLARSNPTRRAREKRAMQLLSKQGSGLVNHSIRGFISSSKTCCPKHPDACNEHPARALTRGGKVVGREGWATVGHSSLANLVLPFQLAMEDLLAGCSRRADYFVGLHAVRPSLIGSGQLPEASWDPWS